MADQEMDTAALADLGALADAATARPWMQARHIDEPRAIVAQSRPMHSLLGLDRDGMAIVDREADAAFIVAAVNAHDALAAEVVRLRALATPPAEPEMAKFRATKGEIVEGRARCAVNVGAIEFCYPLATLLDQQAEKASPVLEVAPRVARDHGRERVSVIFNTSRRGFAAFDFCPFCGTSIVTTFPPAADAAPTGGT